MEARHRGLRERYAIATVVDVNMWRHAAVLVKQLVDVDTTLPIIVFNITAVPHAAVVLLHSLGGHLASLDPPMPTPPELSSPLLSRPFISASGAPNLGRYAPWAKLAVWGQYARWSKILLLDVDVVLLGNVDEMLGFPADTFSPETCNNLSPARCAASDDQTRDVTAGFNSGVMVVGPSARRFASMSVFATSRIAQLVRECTTREQASTIERQYLAYPEQSFLKRFWPTVMKSTIEGGRNRGGYNWQWRTHRESVSAMRECQREVRSAAAVGSSATMPEDEGCGTTHFMSRIYNARPYDCHTCSAPYSARVRIVHYTCSYKPWSRPKDAWARCASVNTSCPVGVQPCAAAWTLRWHRARNAVCERAVALGLTEGTGC